MTTKSNYVKGLTTVAVGLAAGAGYYFVAITGTIAIYSIVKYFGKIESAFMSGRARVVNISIVFDLDESFHHFLELGIDKSWRVLKFYDGSYEGLRIDKRLYYQITLKLEPSIRVKEFLFITKQ